MTRREALALGVRDSSALPGIVVMIGMIGFGSLCRETGFSLSFAVAVSGGMWALPGQIAYVELAAAGNALVAILLAVAMVNARFMPMTATLMPYMRDPTKKPVWLYVMAQFVSFNAWIWMARRFSIVPLSARPSYFVGFCAVLFVLGMAGTVAGYWLAGAVPPAVALGLVFVNVIYFALMFADLREMAPLISSIAGAIGAPLLHMLSPDWGLLATGLLCGTIGFAVARRLGRHVD